MHTTRKSAIERRNRQPVLKHLLSHLGMQAMADSQKARENQLVAAALIAKKSTIPAISVQNDLQSCQHQESLKLLSEKDRVKQARLRKEFQCT